MFICFLSVREGRLIITLEEPGGPPYALRVHVSDSAANHSTPRRIDLVPGRTFHLYCEERGRGRSLEAIWYFGDDEVADGSPSDPNRPMVYSYLESNRRTLVLTNFTSGNVGVYRCRERGTSNTNGAAVVIGTGK